MLLWSPRCCGCNLLVNCCDPEDRIYVKRAIVFGTDPPETFDLDAYDESTPGDLPWDALRARIVGSGEGGWKCWNVYSKLRSQEECASVGDLVEIEVDPEYDCAADCGPVYMTLCDGSNPIVVAGIPDALTLGVQRLVDGVCRVVTTSACGEEPEEVTIGEPCCCCYVLPDCALLADPVVTDSDLVEHLGKTVFSRGACRTIGCTTCDTAEEIVSVTPTKIYEDCAECYGDHYCEVIGAYAIKVRMNGATFTGDEPCDGCDGYFGSENEHTLNFGGGAGFTVPSGESAGPNTVGCTQEILCGFSRCSTLCVASCGGYGAVTGIGFDTSCPESPVRVIEGASIINDGGWRWCYTIVMQKVCYTWDEALGDLGAIPCSVFFAVGIYEYAVFVSDPMTPEDFVAQSSWTLDNVETGAGPPWIGGGNSGICAGQFGTSVTIRRADFQAGSGDDCLTFSRYGKCCGDENSPEEFVVPGFGAPTKIEVDEEGVPTGSCYTLIGYEFDEPSGQVSNPDLYLDSPGEGNCLGCLGQSPEIGDPICNGCCAKITLGGEDYGLASVRFDLRQLFCDRPCAIGCFVIGLGGCDDPLTETYSSTFDFLNGPAVPNNGLSGIYPVECNGFIESNGVSVAHGIHTVHGECPGHAGSYEMYWSAQWGIANEAGNCYLYAFFSYHTIDPSGETGSGGEAEYRGLIPPGECGQFKRVTLTRLFGSAGEFCLCDGSTAAFGECIWPENLSATMVFHEPQECPT